MYFFSGLRRLPHESGRNAMRIEGQPAVSPIRRVGHFQKNLSGAVAAFRWYPELDLSPRTDRLLFSATPPVTSFFVTFPHPHPVIPSRQQVLFPDRWSVFNARGKASSLESLR
jgi:hypothetical protein